MAELNHASAWPLRAAGIHLTLSGRTVLHPSSFTLEGPTVTAVLGANGAGKSVLLRLLHGLIAPDGGSISWGGQSQTRPCEAMMFQRPVLLRRSVLANLEYALALSRLPRGERRQRALAGLDRTRLAHLRHSFARVLSIGEQQLVALARAWILEPAVLFLDEPTASLDPASASRVESIIGEIAQAGTGVILVTHHPAQARRLARDVLFVADGRVTEHTPTQEFFNQPRSPEARRYLEEIRP
jgi:tungstate transport system ATP-binding protein